MIQPDDRVAVGVSGGKDSLYLLYRVAMMRRYYPKRYTVVALTADPCFGGQETDYSPLPPCALPGCGIPSAPHAPGGDHL